jgi:hypothetical protein
VALLPQLRKSPLPPAFDHSAKSVICRINNSESAKVLNKDVMQTYVGAPQMPSGDRRWKIVEFTARRHGREPHAIIETHPTARPNTSKQRSHHRGDVGGIGKLSPRAAASKGPGKSSHGTVFGVGGEPPSAGPDPMPPTITRRLTPRRLRRPPDLCRVLSRIATGTTA